MNDGVMEYVNVEKYLKNLQWKSRKSAGRSANIPNTKYEELFREFMVVVMNANSLLLYMLYAKLRIVPTIFLQKPA